MGRRAGGDAGLAARGLSVKVQVRSGYLGAHVSMFGIVVASMFMGLVAPTVMWLATTAIVIVYGEETTP